MSEKIRVRVFDDDFGRANHWCEKLSRVSGFEDHYRADVLVVEDLKACIDSLRQRQTLARSEAFEPDARWEHTCELDECDVLLVDYDLVDASLRILTGEDLAYLVRCYSSCGLIVGVNQFGPNPFDLTLQGHPESFADLNVGERQLFNSGLWFARRDETFRPWHWPVIQEAVETQRQRVEDLASDAMGTSILEFLGFKAEEVRFLDRAALEWLGKDPEKTTFEDFVQESGNGLRGRAKAHRDLTSLDCERRIAAARISKWLERLVLPSQLVLVDAPHLALEYPSLFDSRDYRALTPEILDQLCAANEEKNSAIPSGAKFAQTAWLHRPAWFLPRIQEDSTVREVADPWSAPLNWDLVFCEDTSRFARRSEAKLFWVEHGGLDRPRWVCGIAEVDYAPPGRFAR